MIFIEDYNLKDKIWYHGTRSLKEAKLNPPSIDKPFFITNDLDYASKYSMFIDMKIGDVYYDENSKVLLVTLDPNVIKIFNFHSESDLNKLDLNADFKKMLMNKNQIFDVFSKVNTLIRLIISWYNNNNSTNVKSIRSIKPEDLIDTISKVDMRGMLSIKDGIFKIQNSDKKTYTEISDLNKFLNYFITEFDEQYFVMTPNRGMHVRVMSYNAFKPLMEKIKHLRYNAFMNLELNGNVECIGIIDVEALDKVSYKLYNADELKM